MQGWIKLHRGLLDWEWYSDTNTTRLFIHLLLSANHKDKRYQGRLIKRGQLKTGRFELSRQTGLSEQSIRTCLSRLKSTSEITIKSTSKFSIITIEKFDAYQTFDVPANQQINHQANQQVTSNQPASNHKQECKEYKESKNNNKNAFDFSKWPRTPGEDFMDFMVQARKTKRLTPLSQSIIDKIGVELKSAISNGHTLSDCVTEWELKGWGGFMAKYMSNSSGSPSVASGCAEGLQAWGKINDILPRYNPHSNNSLESLNEIARGALNKIGGMHQLSHMSSYDIGKKRSAFLDTYDALKNKGK